MTLQPWCDYCRAERASRRVFGVLQGTAQRDYDPPQLLCWTCLFHRRLREGIHAELITEPIPRGLDEELRADGEVVRRKW